MTRIQEHKTPMGKNRRFLIGKSLRKNNKDKITQQEVSLAMQAFKKKGGLIRELPPQRADHRPLVGNPQAAAYETVIEY